VSVVTPLSVCWDGDAGGSRLAEPCGLALLGVREQAAREAARLRIRAVLTTVLAAHFGIDAGRVALHSPEGVAPCAVVALDAGISGFSLSISHDGDISVAVLFQRYGWYRCDADLAHTGLAGSGARLPGAGRSP
jgi:hypothetical protein